MLGSSLSHLAYCKSHRSSSSSASSWSLRKFTPLWPVTLAICSKLTIFAFFSFLTVVFLARWFVNFFLTFFKASTSYGYFHYVSYGIFAHWFSLDQMFKFSVSFATEVEKNRPSHGCFNRGLRSTKDSKRATGHLSPPTNNHGKLVSLFIQIAENSWFACCCNRCSLFFLL